MKHLNVLTFAASAALAAFLASLAAGLVSLTVFIAAAMAWVLLLAVYAYTPTRERSWLPRRSAAIDASSGAAAATSASLARRTASLPLAA